MKEGRLEQVRRQAIDECINIVENRPRGKQWLGGMIVADDKGEIIHRKTLLEELESLKQKQ